MTELPLNFGYVLTRSQQLLSMQEELILRNQTLKQSVDSNSRAVAIIDVGREFYRKAVDIIYETSVGALQKLLSDGVQYIFFDKRYSIKVELDDKRGKSLTFILVDESQEIPIEVDIKDGIGAGVRAVISFLIHFYYLHNRTTPPIMLIDEAYTQVSDDYIERFFSFIQAICREKGLILVLITHDMARIKGFADRVYVVSDGRVSSLPVT